MFLLIVQVRKMQTQDTVQDRRPHLRPHLHLHQLEHPLQRKAAPVQEKLVLPVTEADRLSNGIQMIRQNSLIGRRVHYAMEKGITTSSFTILCDKRVEDYLGYRY